MSFAFKCVSLAVVILLAAPALARAQAAEGLGSGLVGGGALEKSPAATAKTGSAKPGTAASDHAKPNTPSKSGPDPSSGSSSPSTNPE